MEMLQMLVAIVDDDAVVRESLLDLLDVSGYSVVTFASAADFLESPRIPEMRCLLLDISMPGMSGIDLYKELNRRKIAIPVVFMTGHAQEALINEAKRAGICLFKPFAGAELRRAIETAIEI
ncbi:response regulator [Rhizobium sp. BK060]|uniref:response regulator transcription factor n=1 Tax=Rhizobium sp. BK060 TaxID=2587096 RepID=UPI0017E26E0A|nr:response regulator [Rhizobium sp. BK060]MBB3397434.1 FixJ family two-component response regulator [Rhizobium sp. BK060]